MEQNTLLDTLKTYLDITWSDPHTDAKLTGILTRAQDKLRAYAGNAALAFADGTATQQLLLDLCRYIWNNASEDFEDNYRADLIMRRANHKSEAMPDESETQDSGAGA